MSVYKFAGNFQSSGGRYSSDAWGWIELSAGTLLYGGVPGQSEYYTDLETLREFAHSPEDLWHALQVPPSKRTGTYRQDLAQYMVLHPVSVPAGRCTRNAVFGQGGGFQYLIVAYRELLMKIKEGPIRQIANV